MTEFFTSPTLNGFLTNADLLFSVGTFTFEIQKKDLKFNGTIFLLSDSDDHFVFELSVQNQCLVLQRNETVSILRFDEFSDLKPMRVFVIWGDDSLGLSCVQGDVKKTTKVPTVPCPPSSALIVWARKNNLIPIVEFESESDFRNKVCACLQSIQAKVGYTGAVSQFWDYQYEGQKIISRRPKKEVEVHPAVNALLYDQMLMSSIEVVPEYKTGVGAVDFVFIASIKGRGCVKICAEFKNAHSVDLESGLIRQLPEYMKNTNIKYGFYCVLNYKGDWFDEPKTVDNQSLDLMLSKKQASQSNPILDNVRTLIFDLSKSVTASKL